MAEVNSSIPNEAPTKPLARIITSHGRAVIQFLVVPARSLINPYGASRDSPCQITT